MFNLKLRKEALAVYQNENKRYNQSYAGMVDRCNCLGEAKANSDKLLESVEEIVNSITNTPKGFKKHVEQIAERRMFFHSAEKYAEDAHRNAVKAGIGVAGGFTAGGAMVAFGSIAARDVALTFGRISTEAAIKQLSKTVATKAAFTLLGGEAIASCGGIAVGETVLALAGPIGWGLMGADIIFTGYSLNRKNKKIADKAVDEARKIINARAALDQTSRNVEQLSAEIKLQLNNLTQMVNECRQYRGADYISLSDDSRIMLGSLVNNASSLSALIQKTIGSDTK